MPNRPLAHICFLVRVLVGEGVAHERAPVKG